MRLAHCMRRLTAFLSLTLGAGCLAGVASAADLCNNWNTEAVTQGALRIGRTNCFLKEAANVTQIDTYHWNKGLGAKPGTISFLDVATNKTYTFTATGASGQNNAKNVDWYANLNLSFPANTQLQVWDSSPQTWSYNAQSTSYNSPGGGYGFVKIEGSFTATAAPPPPPPGGSTPKPVSASSCPTGDVQGKPIGGLNCPCNYPVGWGTSNVNQTNPGLKNWYPSCAAPLQCVSPNGGGYGTSICQY
jgi:hypothetical protein